jgi:hypothetical protein
MRKTTKGLIKHGVQFAVSTELVALGKRIKENNKKQALEQQKKAEEPPAEQVWEYIFEEEGLYIINDVISGLIETLLLNGIEIDSNLLTQSKEMIECVDALLKGTKKDRTNDSNL